MTPASGDPSPYLPGSPACDTGKRRIAMFTHVVARKSEIIFKIFASLFEVSSNPGVLTNVTTIPSRVSSSTAWTSVVGDSEPVPICRFEPDARLIN